MLRLNATQELTHNLSIFACGLFQLFFIKSTGGSTTGSGGGFIQMFPVKPPPASPPTNTPPSQPLQAPAQPQCEPRFRWDSSQQQCVVS
jgi:hypothetical protein